VQTFEQNEESPIYFWSTRQTYENIQKGNRRLFLICCKNTKSRFNSNWLKRIFQEFDWEFLLGHSTRRRYGKSSLERWFERASKLRLPYAFDAFLQFCFHEQIIESIILRHNQEKDVSFFVAFRADKNAFCFEIINQICLLSVT
jgi:hypothetical protein